MLISSGAHLELLRIAGATINQTPLDFKGNAARIKAVLEEAKAREVDFLCLPELAISGYGCEDAFFSLATTAAAEAVLKALLPATSGITVVIGLPHFFAGALYNCAALVQDGKVLGVNAKRVLPREGVHYEPRWFRPWPFGKVASTHLAGFDVPIGDLRYRLGNLGVAVEICEEAWASVPASASHASSVELIVNPSASHFAFGKYTRREHLVANSSRAMQVTYLYTNMVGCEAGRLIYDGGVLMAEAGVIIARGPRFGFRDSYITVRDVNPEAARVAKLRGIPVRDGDAEVGAGVEVQGVDLRRIRSRRAASSGLAPLVAYRGFEQAEEFLLAEALGLFDYCRKSRAAGFVLSLSGGCDSSTCAVLVGQMVALAVEELGLESAWRRLVGVKAQSEPSTLQDFVSRALTCIYQRTSYSGSVTENAARDVAGAIGARFHVADVQPMVDQYLAAAAPTLGRTLSWAKDDVALQNIQARARAPLPWILANVEGKLLVSTSNRSECAVGYATMDGDTAGGLAPLAGIDKHYLRQWLRWAEADCSLGLGKIAALGSVNSQAPTAELRPSSAAQTDEADLMPYAVLDRIERLFVLDRLGVDDIDASLAREMPNLGERERREYIARFMALWARNQWKRERLAPSFHIDEFSLDPKTWCRFPILSG